MNDFTYSVGELLLAWGIHRRRRVVKRSKPIREECCFCILLSQCCSTTIACQPRGPAVVDLVALRRGDHCASQVLTSPLLSHEDLIDNARVDPPTNRADLLTGVHGHREELGVGDDCSRGMVFGDECEIAGDGWFRSGSATNQMGGVSGSNAGLMRRIEWPLVSTSE